MIISEIRATKVGSVIRDDIVPGLQLRTFENRRSFYLYYRTRTGIQRKPKIGDWPSITIDQARQIGRKWLAKVAQGGDPSKDRKDAIAAPSMTDLRDRYLARHASRKKTAAADANSFRLHIIPTMGRLRVADVTPDDIERFMSSMAKKGSPIQGNRCLSLMSKAFNLAIKWRWRTDNPCKGADRFPEKKRRRYMSADEYTRLWSALETLQVESPYGVACIQILMLTGARLGEIIHARRDWLRNGVLCLPDSKTGEKEIHMPTQALEIIRALPAIDGLLIGIRSRPTKVWNRALAIAEITDLRIHDLRHSYASTALSAGMTLSQIGELLGHKSTQTTKRYAHLEDIFRREAAVKIADNIAGKVGLGVAV